MYINLCEIRSIKKFLSTIKFALVNKYIKKIEKINRQSLIFAYNFL